ncbi:MAG: S41 family peptidase [Candidatus Obscuribacterales bacterium]|jgi:carboxyl-terminal processing protease
MAQERAESLKAIAKIDTSKCPRSPEYETVIEVFARNLYDPTKIGDLQALKSKHNCEIKMPGDAVKFANKEISALDGHSVLHTKPEIEAMRLEEKGDLVGIGATFTRPNAIDANTDKGPITVASLIKDAPAQKAGLRVGDQIVAIDKKPVELEHLSNAIERVRGTSESTVKLTVARDGRTIDLDITRAQVHFPTVSEKSLSDGIAYVRLNSFVPERGPIELYNALEKHKSAKAVVFDLRNNLGGAENNAVLTAALFMDHGVITNLRQRVDSSPQAPIFADRSYALSKDSTVVTKGGASKSYGRPPDMVNVPVVVLVNEYSASASELVAGALRDNGDAKLVGTQTYGKGVGQAFIPIPSVDGLLRVTTVKDTTPNGHWVGDGSKNKIGLKPDIEVKLPEGVRLGAANDTQLNAAVLYLKTQIAAGRKAH